MLKLLITSSDFENNSRIPRKYTCDGKDVNPPLDIEGVPKKTKSLVLIVDDPDAPMGNFNHWVVWNIVPTEKMHERTDVGIEGLNDFRKHFYGGSCPPSVSHRCFFEVYALDTELSLPVHPRKKDLEEAMSRHILDSGELLGLYKR